MSGIVTVVVTAAASVTVEGAAVVTEAIFEAVTLVVNVVSGDIFSAVGVLDLIMSGDVNLCGCVENLDEPNPRLSVVGGDGLVLYLYSSQDLLSRVEPDEKLKFEFFE